MIHVTLTPAQVRTLTAIEHVEDARGATRLQDLVGAMKGSQRAHVIESLHALKSRRYASRLDSGNWTLTQSGRAALGREIARVGR